MERWWILDSQHHGLGDVFITEKALGVQNEVNFKQSTEVLLSSSKAPKGHEIYCHSDDIKKNTILIQNILKPDIVKHSIGQNNE